MPASLWDAPFFVSKCHIGNELIDKFRREEGYRTQRVPHRLHVLPDFVCNVAGDPDVVSCEVAVPRNHIPYMKPAQSEYGLNSRKSDSRYRRTLVKEA